MAHKNRRDRTPNRLKQSNLDSNESDYSDSPESRSSDEDSSSSASYSSASEELSGDEESPDLSSSEENSEQYQKLRKEYQKMCDKYEELRTQYSDLVKSSSSARKIERKSSRKKRGRSTKTSRATRASELSSSPTNFPRSYSAVKPKKSEFMIDPNMPLSERMARRHVSHLSTDFISIKTAKSEEISLQKSHESPRPRSAQLSHSSASTTSNPLFQSDILSNCFVNELDERGVTPLIHAIEFGDTELLRDLIDNQGADVNVPNSEGEVPLLIAMKKRRPDIAMLLLERHAEVNVTVPLLLNTPLHLCFLEDIFRPEFVDQLLHRQDLEIDAQNNLGNTPLFLAVYAKEVEYVTMLLQRGANVHLRNKHGVTPLLTACEIGAFECAEQLVTFGADVNTVDNHGESGLHKAAKHGHERVVEMLLQRKVNPRIENNMRSRAIDLPSTHRIKKLLEDYDPGTRAWKWETSFNEVNFDRNIILGDGEFGTVFKGALHGTPVAVKMLKMDINRIDQVTKQSFEYEVGLMSEIHHPNILMFLGASTTDEGVPCIITEYLPRGSLRKYLMTELTWPNVLRCAITTARGMAWLHSRKPIILHRDLHTNNILVADSGECKVADFGLSAVAGSILASNKIYKRIRPPEVENKIQLYSRESDVYMYGLVLFELLTKKKASKDNTTYEHFKVLKEEYQQSPTVITFLSIIEECVATDPQKRPDFETILASLESLEAQKDVFVAEQDVLSSIQRKGLDSAKNYGKPSKNNNNTNNTNENINTGANGLKFSGRAYYVEGADDEGDEVSQMGKLNAPKYE